nr:glycosyltransferase family 61 protein [Haloplanus sp. XH21]
MIPADPPSWLLSSLSLAGVDTDRLIEWSGTRARCSHAVLGSLRRNTSSTSDGYIHSPAAAARLGERIRKSVAGTHSTGPGRRLYVSRADTTDRRVRNEDALLSVLDDYGFDRIVPGELSFETQVRRFSNAEIVLGPHGAGLTNMIFSEEATLIELFGSYRNACFFALAKGMGHEYVSVTCQSAGSDMIADTEAIASLLDDIVPHD